MICAGNRVNAPTCNCPEGTYETNVPTCPSCDEKCATCIDNPTNCTTCASDREQAPPECPILPPAISSVKVTDIPVGSAVTVNCDFKCKTCAEAHNNCITCDANRHQPPSCPCLAGHFESEEVCHPCSYKCVDCTSADVCTTCSGNRN